MKRIVEYDAVRVFAMLLVILGHCTYYTLMTDYGGMNFDIDSSQFSLAFKIFARINNVIYKFHMPLFMALSGAVFALTIKGNLGSFKSHFLKKWKRIMSPMLITAIFLSIPIKYISGYWQSTGMELLRDIISGQILMMGNSNSHLWFLQALFWIFIIAWCIERFNLRKNRIVFYAILFALFIGSIYIVDILNINNACSYLVWFYVGFELELHREKINKLFDKITAKHLIYLVPCFVLLASLPFPDLFRFGNKIINFIISLIGICISYFACYKISRYDRVANSRFLASLTVASFGLYLYSDPFNYLILSFIKSFGLEHMLYSNFGSIIIYATRFLLTFALAWGVILIEQKLKSYYKNIVQII